MPNTTSPHEIYPSQVNVVCLGGGGGGQTMAETAGNHLTPLLGELGYETFVTILSPTGDSGGSTGELRHPLASKHGTPLPAVGDLRKAAAPFLRPEVAKVFEPRLTADDGIDSLVNMCTSGGVAPEIIGDVVAMADRSLLVRKRLRKEQNLRGHTLGNIILAALTDEIGIQSAADYIRQHYFTDPIHHRVLPASNDSYGLTLTEGNGTVTYDEHNIDEKPIEDPQDAQLSLTPGTKINPDAARAIEDADLITIGPGSVFTSILHLLEIEGMRRTINEAKGRLGVVANISRDRHDPHAWTVADHLRVVTRGLRPVDGLIFNNSLDALPTGTRPVVLNPADYLERIGSIRVIGAPLAHRAPTPDQNDALAHGRSEVVHNHRVLARAMMEMLDLSASGDLTGKQIDHRKLIPV